MLEIFKLDSGFLSLVFEGNTFEKINLVRLFPYEYEYEYIAILGADNKEITMIRDLRDLDYSSRQIVAEHLRYKYYMPEITKVKSIREKMGFLYVNVETTSGAKEVCVADFVSNIRVISDKILSITDVEGNKYRINDFNQLDRLSRKKLDVFI